MDDAGKGVDLDKPSIRDAVSSGARIINMSYVDDIGDPSGVRDDILYALRHGVVVVSARDNSCQGRHVRPGRRAGDEQLFPR